MNKKQNKAKVSRLGFFALAKAIVINARLTLSHLLLITGNNVYGHSERGIKFLV